LNRLKPNMLASFGMGKVAEPVPEAEVRMTV
jgi:hypothetical protein